MPESADQKTEKPTQRKLRKAREEGMVAQSVEVNNALVLLAAVGALALFGGAMFRGVTGAMTDALGGLGRPELTIEGTSRLMQEFFGVILRGALPIMLFVGAVGLLCSLAQTGVVLVPKKIMPQLAHINPVNGAKNLFSLKAVMRLVTAALKLTAIGAIVYLFVRSRTGWLFAISGKSVLGVLLAVRELCASLLLRIIAAMFAIAVIDFAYQKWQQRRELMMTKSELKEEHKRDEGNPEVRGKQAQMRRAVARARMIQAVPSATVVVTNPTHVAVALRWQEGDMGAPTVVAKGQDHMARRIRQVAEQHEVPVLERRLLARTLYQVVEVGQEIPSKLYQAVAEVLAFVLKRARKGA